MVISAALLMFATVTLGAIVAGFWSHPERRRTDPRSHRLGTAHVITGLTAVAAWVTYLIARNETVGTAAVTALVVAATLGTSAFVSTRQRDRTADYEDRPDPVPPVVLLLHGAGALSAIVIAFLAVA